MKRAVQKFTPEYLRHSRRISPTQAAQFLEDYRKIYFASQMKVKSRLISIKVPEPLLNAFREKARAAGLKYQSQIKKLMEEWLKKM